MTQTADWLDDFFRSYYKFRPVNATFVGMHKYDNLLPSFTEENVRIYFSDMKRLLEESSKAEPTNRMESIDLELASNFLKLQLSELEGRHFHRGNPATYSSESIFGLISLCLREFAPKTERMNSMIRRMKQIPSLLVAGEQNIRSAPREWTNEAIRQCDGGIIFLSTGVRILLSEWDVPAPHDYLEQSEVALRAFREYREYLSEELLHQHVEGYSTGSGFFDELVQKGHMLSEMDADKISSFANERLQEKKNELRKETSKIRPDGDWNALIAELSKKHPAVDGILTSCQSYWEDCRRTVIDNELVDWPDYSLIYRFIPAYLREAAPYLYFLFYRSPAPLDNLKVNEYLLTPIAPSLPEPELEQKLRAVNYSVIKHNHVVHHGALGHHIQNYYAYRGKSRIGTISGVDCASRIAMFCGGTMAEGWATYSTTLMDEVGFNTQDEHIAELHSQLRLISRSVVDSNLHSGRFSFEDAVNFYVNEVGMTPKAALNEVVKNSAFPCTGSMYLLGLDGIVTLRREIARNEGSNFNIKRFHNSLLSFGSVPVSVIKQEMMSG